MQFYIKVNSEKPIRYGAKLLFVAGQKSEMDVSVINKFLPHPVNQKGHLCFQLQFSPRTNTGIVTAL